MMKQLISSLLLLAGLATMSSCKKNDTTTPAPSPMTVSGDLTGANQVPAVMSPGSGKVTGTYDTVSKELNYTVTYANMSGPAVAGHFHIAPPGMANPMPTLAFPGPYPSGNSGTITSKATLTQTQIDALLAGNLYANLHTQMYGGGELRANLTAK